jgi:hypothetical protein
MEIDLAMRLSELTGEGIPLSGSKSIPKKSLREGGFFILN